MNASCLTGTRRRSRGPELPNISRKECTRIQAEPQEYLDALLSSATHRASEARSRRDQLERAAESVPASRPETAWASALRHGADVSVVAEVKRRSPSAGPIAPGLDAADYAARCAAAGARAISVLTEPSAFDGSLGDLRAVANRVRVPTLRKDFLLDEAQLLEAFVEGAAAVLLIARILSDGQLAGLVASAEAIGIGSLVEIHDETELERVLHLPAAPTAIGVNARDLSTFRVDLGASERLLALIPREIPAIAESGVSSSEDVAVLAAAGADAVLVGTAIGRAADPETAVRQLTGVPRRGR